MTKFLITGGAGFIGSNFIHCILERYPYYQVINLDKLTYCGNPDNLKEAEKNPRYKFIKGDVCDRSLVEDIFEAEKPEVVVHFAAESHVDRSILEPEAFLKTNVFGTYVLLEAAQKYKVSRFLQIGTDEEYGTVKEGLFKETDIVNPSSPYSSSKAAASLLALSYFKTYGLPVLVTRSSNNFGRFQFPEKVIPLFITNILEGKKVPLYGEGRNVRDWIYVEDNCLGIDTVLHKGKIGEIYNIGSGNEKANLELTQIILQELGKDDDWIEYVKDRPGHDFRYALDTSKVQGLGWQPQHNFHEAIKKTIDWYKENPWWWQKLKSEEYLEYYKKQYGERPRQILDIVN